MRANSCGELALEQRVERGERLVEQQHLGLEHERASERDPLRLAAGELVRAARLVAGEPHALERLRDSRGRSALGTPRIASP